MDSAGHAVVASAGFTVIYQTPILELQYELFSGDGWQRHAGRPLDGGVVGGPRSGVMTCRVRSHRSRSGGSRRQALAARWPVKDGIGEGCGDASPCGMPPAGRSPVDPAGL